MKKLIGLLILLVITGCGVYTNLTTYFNRYYNAKEEYQKAEEEINLARKSLFEFRKDNPVSKAQEPLKKVIEICSKIMQYNSESSYVNHAIFMTGQAFYHQNNFLKAQRKFEEVLAINNEDFYLKGKLWLGKTLLQLRVIDKGLKYLDEAIDSAVVNEEEEIVSDGLIAKISYLLFKEDYTQAIKDIKRLINNTSNDEMKSEANYELGKIFVFLKDYPNALLAYEEVLSYTPLPEIEIKSRLEIGKLKRMLQKYDEALEYFEELKATSKYQKFLGMIEIEIGNTHSALTDYKPAMNSYVFVDTTYSREEIGGVGCYHRGRVWEELMIFDSAMTYYNKLSVRMAPREYKDTAAQKIKLLKTYVDLKTNLNNHLTQKNYKLDNSLFLKDSLAYVNKREQDSLKLLEWYAITKANYTSTSLTYDLNTKSKKPEKLKLSLDSLNSLIYRKNYELGNYFFTDNYLPDSAAKYFDYTLKNYPDTLKNANIYFSIASFYNLTGNNRIADSLYSIVYSRFKENKLANEAARKLKLPVYEVDKDTAEAVFKSAENLYYEKKINESLGKYYSVYKNYPSSPFAPKSLFTLGWIWENDKKDLDSAFYYYDTLFVKYPTSEFTAKTRTKVDFIKTERLKMLKVQSDSAVTDSTLIEAGKTNTRQDAVPEVKTDEKIKSDEKIRSDENIIDRNKLIPGRDSVKTSLPDSIKNTIRNVVPKKEGKIPIPKNSKDSTLLKNAKEAIEK